MIEEKLNKAINTASILLTALQIKRVVYVDDKNIKGASIETILASVSDIDIENLQAAISALNLELPSEKEMWETGLRSAWNEGDENLQGEISKALLPLGNGTVHGDEDLDDFGASAILSQLIPAGMMHAITPGQWNDQKTTFLAEAESEPTLFLFDQDFGDGNVTGGIDIIREILSDQDAPMRFCGLITHTVTPEDQIERWTELSESIEVSRDKFIVIPKQHLSSDPELVCYCLKLVALSPHFAKLKKTTAEVISQSTQRATERIESVNIFDLEYMVFRSGINEGNWEPDLLFRLHSLFQRSAARGFASHRQELEDVSENLRRLSSVTLASHPTLLKNTWDIQREELYEDPVYLNGNRLPLELGDIFRKGDGGRQFVLIGQPCDLMLRTDGKRYPDLEFAVLAELKLGKVTNKQTQEDLPFYGSGFDDRWHVNLKRTHLVKTCILDLCSFNDNGAAKIDLKATSSPRLRPSLSKRFGKIQGEFRSLARRMDEFLPSDQESRETSQLKARCRKALQDHYLDGGLFKGKRTASAASDTIEFDCSRIGRISAERAFGLLIAYTSSIGRPAFPIDFAPSSDVGCSCVVGAGD